LKTATPKRIEMDATSEKLNARLVGKAPEWATTTVVSVVNTATTEIKDAHIAML
jgi:hypothetical protein